MNSLLNVSAASFSLLSLSFSSFLLAAFADARTQLDRRGAREKESADSRGDIRKDRR